MLDHVKRAGSGSQIAKLVLSLLYLLLLLLLLHFGSSGKQALILPPGILHDFCISVHIH